MKRLRRLKPLLNLEGRVRDERGASLMLVIVFVMVFSVMCAVLLDFASTGFKTTTAVAKVRDDQHAIDAAVEGAINAIRGSATLGFATGGDCDFAYIDPSGSPSVAVNCEPAGTTVFTGGPDDLQPKFAILAVGSGVCDGFALGGTEPMSVAGGIGSNSRLGVGDDVGCGDGVTGNSQSAVHVFGDAVSTRACTTARLTATGRFACNTGVETSSVPAYLPAVPNIGAMAVVPPAEYIDPPVLCTGSNFATFSPGVYTEVPTYHVARAGCAGKVWWFKPGNYYFDFPATDDEWFIDDEKVIGGTPNGWTTSSSFAGVNVTTGCVDPGLSDPISPAGVQFIFGGTSHIRVQGSGSGTSGLTLCAGQGEGTSKQRISIFSLHAGGNTRVPVTAGVFRTATTPTSDFTLPLIAPGAGAVTAGDGIVAQKPLSSAGPTSGFVTFADFADIPNGSLVTSVGVKVTHSEGASSAKMEPKLTLSYVDGSGTTVKVLDNVDLTKQSSLLSETINVPLSSLGANFNWRDVNSFTASYLVEDERNPKLTATTGPPCTPTTPPVCTVYPELTTVELDGVEIIVDYTPPGFRPQSSTEPFLETGNNPTAIFRGTFFAPSGDLKINVHNAGTTVFQRGVVAKSITGNIGDSSKQTDSPFSIPGLTHKRVVVFEAAISGTVRLRARVSYDDSGSLPGRSVKVLDWVVVR